MLTNQVEFSIKIFGYLKKGSYIYPVVKLKNKIKVMNITIEDRDRKELIEAIMDGRTFS